MKKILCFVTLIFLFSFLTGVVVFIVYVNTSIGKEIKNLSIEESAIIEQQGVSKEKYIFRAFPEAHLVSQISGYGQKGLRLAFQGNGQKQYLGFHLYLSLVIGEKLKDGTIEFWLSGKEDYPLIKKIGLSLKSGHSGIDLINISLPVNVSKTPQKFILPVQEFFMPETQYEFQDVFFFVEPFECYASAEIFVKNLVIRNKGKVIYDLL